MSGWGCKNDTTGNLLNIPAECLRMLAHFQMGPNLVRGFAPDRHRAPRSHADRIHWHG